MKHPIEQEEGSFILVNVKMLKGLTLEKLVTLEAFVDKSNKEEGRSIIRLVYGEPILLEGIPT